MTYTNAGLRVYDISNARLPREIGYFVPPNREKKNNILCFWEGGVSNGADVLVDTRGYITCPNRSQGIWVPPIHRPEPGPAIPVHYARATWGPRERLPVTLDELKEAGMKFPGSTDHRRWIVDSTCINDDAPGASPGQSCFA